MPMAGHDSHIAHTERHFDALSHDYDDYASRRRSYVGRVDDFVAERLAALDPCSYLDVGCGTGRLLKKLAHRLPASRGIGIDVSSKMVERCRGEGLDVRKTDFIEWTPEPPVDALVLEFNVFGYLVVQNGLETTLDHMRRIVGEQGQLLFDILNPFCITYASPWKTVPEALRRRARLAREGGLFAFDYAIGGNDITMGIVDRRLVEDYFARHGWSCEVHWIEYSDSWLSRVLPPGLTSQPLFSVRSP